MKFFDELKRRNVIKATMAYIVIAWVLIQVLTNILPVFQAPDWVLKTLMILMAVGLPIWMIFSWVYEVTPEGLKKTEQISKDDSVTATTNKRLNIIILIVLLIAIGVHFIEPSNSEPLNNVSSSESFEKNTIAVLPFMDMSPNKDQEFLSDGIAIEIYDELCKYKELSVAGRTSSFSFKDKNEHLTSIGDQLKVNTILEGSVRRQQDKILISVSLANAKDGFIIFSESYTDDMENIFVLQSKIATDIAGKIESNLGLENKVMHQAKKINPLAYENYLKGKLQFVNGPINMKEDEIFMPMKYFENAVKLDSNFAEACAYLSLAYFNMSDWVIEANNVSERRIALDSAKLLAKRALLLDSLSSGAHLAMGSFYFHQYDWVRAEEQKRKAVALNPNGADEKCMLASFLSAFGQAEEGLLLDQEAIKLDPLEIKWKAAYARDMYYSGNYDKCIEYCLLLLQENPNSAGADQFLWLSYGRKKEFERARTVMIHFAKEHLKDSIMSSFFRDNDFKTAVNKMFAYDQESNLHILQNPAHKATFYAFIEDKEHTIKYLYQAYDRREPTISFLRDSRYDFIMDDPRYIELYEKTGFRAYDAYKKKQKSTYEFKPNKLF
jgi:TolB-like protein